MRSFALCLLVLLLPWRLWAADAMAMQTLSWPATAPAQQQPCHGVDSVPDTATHASHADGSTADSAGAHAQHPQCLLCDLCHNALSLPPAAQAGTPPRLHDGPVHGAERIASIHRARDLKPPIS